MTVSNNRYINIWSLKEFHHNYFLMWNILQCFLHHFSTKLTMTTWKISIYWKKKKMKKKFSFFLHLFHSFLSLIYQLPKIFLTYFLNIMTYTYHIISYHISSIESFVDKVDEFSTHHSNFSTQFFFFLFF